MSGEEGGDGGEPGVGGGGGGGERPPLIRRRGKWEARLPVGDSSSRVLYLGKYRSSWDAERALAQATIAQQRVPRTAATPEPPSSKAMVPSRSARPTSSRSDVERTAPAWLVAPSGAGKRTRPSHLVLRAALARSTPVVHVFNASHNLILIGRVMGPQRVALYEPALKPGKPPRCWAPGAPLAKLEDADFSAQRKVGIVLNEGGAYRLHLLQRLLKARSNSFVGAAPVPPSPVPPPPPPQPSGDTVIEVLPADFEPSPNALGGRGDDNRSTGGKWVPIMAWSYGLLGLLCASVPHVGHSGVPSCASTRRGVEMVEETGGEPPPAVRLCRAPSLGSLRPPTLPPSSSTPSPGRDSFGRAVAAAAGGFPSLDLLPGRVLPMEGDEGSDDLYDDSIAPVFASPLASSSFRPSSSSSSLPYRPFSSSSQRSSPPTPLAASGTLLSEFSFGSVGREEEDEEGGPPPFTLRRLPVVPSSASPRGEGEEEPAVFTDYRVEFASPLCALQAATLGICHLSATGHMPAPVSKAPLLPEEEPESGPA